jgi:hypothetical protein
MCSQKKFALTEICYQQGRETHDRRVMLHCANALVHNTNGVQERVAGFGFIRMERPPSSPDFAPCDFFLFSAMKHAFAGQHLLPLTASLWVWKHFRGAFCALLPGRFSGIGTAITVIP